MPSIVNIVGCRFGSLVALAPTPGRTDHGGLIWLCRCDCGTQVEVPYTSLVYANQRSCGCRKRAHSQRLRTLQTRVDGTSLDMIKSQKLPTDNTTGHKGVYLVKGKYQAKIVFQKKAYYMGSYDTLEEAQRARQAAEEAIYQPTLAFHARWKERADRDPQWAAENPMRIFVAKENGELTVSFLPKLED